MRINYTSTSDREIDRIVTQSAEEDRPVLIQKPGIPSGLGSMADEATENFNQLQERLDQRGVQVETYTDPENVGSPLFDSETVKQWGWLAYLTAGLSGLLFVVTWPITALLGLAYRRTGTEKYADVQQAIARTAFVNGDLRRSYIQSKQRQRERISRKVTSIRDETGSDPIVVTNMDVRI